MKRGTPKHPKIYHLCTLLKCRRPTAIGYLEMLWHMAAEYTPQGNIGKYDDAWIEASLDWTGRKGFLVDCLTVAGWLDRDSEWRLLVHDWHEHADSAVRKRLERSALPFHKHSGKVTGQGSVSDWTTDSLARAPALPEPEPQPEPFLSGQSSSRLEKQNGNSKSVTTTDEIKKFATPKDELVALMQETTRHTPEIGVVRKICETLEIRGGTLPAYLVDIRPRIERLSDPPGEGFFLSQAKKWGSSETTPAPQPELVEAKNGNGRCVKCNGVGLVEGKYCTCRMGRDLNAIEARKKKPQQPQTEAS